MRTLTEHDPVMMDNGDLKQLKDVGGDPYTLPTATASRLGGVKVGSGLSVTSAGVLSADGESYTLPAATASTLGGVKVGSGLSVAEDGTLSNAESYTLPAATVETLGGVKVGTGLSVAEDGTLSASGGGGGGPAHLYLVGLKYNYAWLSFYFWSDNATIDIDSVYTALNGFVDNSFVWFYYPANGYYADGTNQYAIVGVQAKNNSFIVFAHGIGQYSMSKGSTTFTYKQIY